MRPIGSLMMGTVAEPGGVSRACAMGGLVGLLLVSGLTIIGRPRGGEPTPPIPDGRAVP